MHYTLNLVRLTQLLQQHEAELFQVAGFSYVTGFSHNGIGFICPTPNKLTASRRIQGGQGHIPVPGSSVYVSGSAAIARKLYDDEAI
jgi:hypothetical protein